MSNQFDSDRYPQNQPGAVQSVQPGGAVRRRITAIQAAARRFLASPRTGSALSFLRRHLVIILFALLVLFPVGGILLGYILRPSVGSPEQAAGGLITNSPDSDKAKPAPGRPMLARTQAPPPVVMHPVPSATLDQQPPSSVSVPSQPLTTAPAMPNPAPNVPPAAPNIPGTQPYTPMVYSARHDKVFGDGCSGQLTLDATGLAFRCPNDPGGSLQVALGDIEAADGNGVRLTSGKKYHFSIAGMGKSNAEQLFANWLSRVR